MIVETLEEIVDQLITWRSKGELIEPFDSCEHRTIGFYPHPRGKESIEISITNLNLNGARNPEAL